MGDILIVDDDEDLRTSMGDFFASSVRARSVAVGSLAELEKVEQAALKCSIAIVDINLGADAPSGVDVLKWLRARGFGGRVAFLTGHADNHPLVKLASREDGVRVYKKPMAIHDLIGLVKDT